jgi:hypothetical protein
LCNRSEIPTEPLYENINGSAHVEFLDVRRREYNIKVDLEKVKVATYRVSWRRVYRHCNERSSSIKGSELLDHLIGYQHSD